MVFVGCLIASAHNVRPESWSKYSPSFLSVFQYKHSQGRKYTPHDYTHKACHRLEHDLTGVNAREKYGAVRFFNLKHVEFSILEIYR